MSFIIVICHTKQYCSYLKSHCPTLLLLTNINISMFGLCVCIIIDSHCCCYCYLLVVTCLKIIFQCSKLNLFGITEIELGGGGEERVVGKTIMFTRFLLT